MKNLAFAFLASSLIFSQAFAQNSLKESTLFLERIDFEMEQVPVEDVLFFTGDVAKGIFEGMKKPVSSKSYTNSCTTSAGNIEVRVEQKNGASFGCEKWPSSCFGKTFYKCEATVNLSNGSIKARQTNN